MLNQDAMHSRPRRSPPAAAPVPTMPPSRRSKRTRNTLRKVFPLSPLTLGSLRTRAGVARSAGLSREPFSSPLVHRVHLTQKQPFVSRIYSWEVRQAAGNGSLPAAA